MHSVLKSTIRASHATWLVFFAFLALSLAPLLAGEPVGSGGSGGRTHKSTAAPTAPGGEGGVVNTPSLYIPHDMLPGPARSTGHGQTLMEAQAAVGRQGLTIALLPNLGRLLVTVQSISKNDSGPVVPGGIHEGGYRIDRTALEELAAANLTTRLVFFRPKDPTIGREAGHLCIDISPMQKNGLVSYRVFYNPVQP